MFSSCYKSTYTTADIQKQDSLTRSQAVKIDEHQSKIDRTVENFTGVFTRYQRDEVNQEVPKIYSQEAYLNDRIHGIKGRDSIKSYFDKTFDKVYAAEFDFQDRYQGSHDVVLRWVMALTINEGEEPRKFMGMSQLRFDHEGQVIYHVDYWDFSEFLSDFWGIGSIMKMIKSKA